MTSLTDHGIPEMLTEQFVEQWVRGRVSGKRFSHICGVVNVADQLASRYGCCVRSARLAGWLHDCCKEVKDAELVRMADELGVPVDDHCRTRGHLLHGPVAAAVVTREFGLTNVEILCAIAEHTMGNAPMSKLSEVVYLADCLEESRPLGYRNKIWDALGREGTELNVPAGLLASMNLSIEQLLESGRPIHPKTVEVRNYYLSRL